MGTWSVILVPNSTAITAGLLSGMRSTGMIDIGTLGGPYAQAMAVNDAGCATGNAR